MPGYVERFKVGHRSAAIEDTEVGFSVWYGGCQISSKIATIEEARRITHEYLVSQLTAEVGGLRERLTRTEAHLSALGDDKFRLGRFLVGE